MNKIEIDTEKQKYLLDGKPIKGLKEITINITTDGIPEVTLTVMGELDAKFNNCCLTKIWHEWRCIHDVKTETNKR